MHDLPGAGSAGWDDAGVAIDEADPRYSLANERTFLAWIRTALGMLAAAAGLLAIDLPWPDLAVRLLAVALAATGGASAFLAWSRWRSVEAAIAAGTTAPPPRVHLGLAGAVAAVAVAVAALALL